jgi:hypothetical protein
VPEWGPTLLTQVNEDYDRNYASDGTSRFGAYLRQRPDEFRSSWSSDPKPLPTPEEFAVAAWRVATPPVMAPGYVSIRPDISRITLHRDDDDGALYAEIRLPLRHFDIGGETKRFPYSWQDWDTEHAPGSDHPYPLLLAPYSTKRPTVLAEVTVRVPGRGWPHLVTPTAYEGKQLLAEARETVSTLVQHINDDAGPMVAKIRGRSMA